jgi:phospholipid:diacylglycerol acyltransferase
METNYSQGLERDEKQLARNDLDPRKWTNPLEIRYVIFKFFVIGTA